ncbi:NRDE family protein [Aquimarina sp. ERC-38]|uniref:NRDE family protein n=1 Tax=Aquimarina sp. ERC-38 TaxID=2949996 RepID=UPI002246CD96|nr:NRDE family protein [Aquimarina sp. ERC-38]UZO82561.1 NRDE family protein [Aquimarina sp. ERC-38]
MCTVTLLPLSEDSFILTSNRDESISRRTIYPKIYEEKDVTILYPKDKEAGGTWIGISSRKRMICLLNGGFKKHNRKQAYRKSRGIVVTDLLKVSNFEKGIAAYNFSDIEPFTLVVADWNATLTCNEIVWDGKVLHKRKLEHKIHIWSSSTLYTDDMKEKRKEWLNSFVNTTVMDANSLLDFHKYGGQGYKSYDIQMDRGELKTRSITQIIKSKEEIEMRYEDLINEEVKTISFEGATIY